MLALWEKLRLYVADKKKNGCAVEIARNFPCTSNHI